MGAITHVKSDTFADFTGTVTVFNSQGSTVTAAATDLVRPADWNSGHNFNVQISGNTSGTSSQAATNVVFGGTNGVTASLSTAAGGATVFMDSPAHWTLSDFIHPGYVGQTQATGPANNSLSIWPVSIPAYLIASRFDVFASVTRATQTNTSSAYHRMSWAAGIYTRVNATSIRTLSSTAQSTTSSWSSNQSLGTVTGIKAISFPWNLTLTPGQYYMAMYWSTDAAATNASTATTSLAHSYTFFNEATTQVLHSLIYGAVPVSVGIGNTNLDAYAQFRGMYATTTAGIPANIGASDVTNTGLTAQRAALVCRFRNW